MKYSRKYRHIFFDLDHTLWDFDRNSEETLLEMYDIYRLGEKGDFSAKTFVDTYKKINDGLWRQYHEGTIGKRELRAIRFRDTLCRLGMQENGLAGVLEEEYLRICPEKPHLLQDARELLNHLSKKYKLNIITNGFIEPTRKKLRSSRIASYFHTVNISEVIGCNKPHAGVFDYALSASGAYRTESVMIGDNPDTDIAGACAYGMDAIFLNREKIVHDYPVVCEISSLKELLHIL